MENYANSSSEKNTQNTKTMDSKKKSASEAFVNSFGGYSIGYALGL